ncbi:MAG: SCO family protein [Dehalococcoidia bacterium]
MTLPAVLGAALLLVACGSEDGGTDATATVDTGADDRSPAMVAEFQPRPSFVLTDTSGARFDFEAETEGFLTLLYFGYTNCPDVCPVHFGNIAAALDQIPSSLRGRVKVIFVGVDPPRDSPERLRSWLDHFDATFIGLTGTDDELRAAQVAAGVPPAQREPADENGRYAVSHAAWVTAYTAGDEQTWWFPIGIRQATWASTIEELAQIGRTDS